MKTRSYIFELPLYVVPPVAFWKFICDIGSPMENMCEVTYYSDGRLFFFSPTLMGKNDIPGKSVCLTPFDSENTSPESIDKFVKTVGKFASLLHCSVVPPADKRKIELSLSLHEDDFKKYGSDLQNVLKVKVTTTDESVKTLYSKLFDYIDPDKNVLNVKDYG